MKKLSKFSKQIVLVIVAVISVASVAYAGISTPWANGFIRDVIDGGGQFIYGHGIVTYDGNPAHTVFGYGYGYDLKDRSSHLPDAEYADYGFENHEGAATVDDTTKTDTTITVDFHTDYLAMTNACYKNNPKDTCSDFESNFNSGSRTVTFENLTCGTLYYIYAQALDAGGQVWTSGMATATTDSCGGTRKHQEIVSGPVIPPKTQLSNASRNPHNLTIPDIILHLGSVGTGVQQLQTLLNYFGTVLAPSGAGSPGEETMYFGQRTYNALKNFQRTFGLEKVDGIYGEQTKAMIESFLN
jgi:hypothetical protein